jgi:excisionase family DNA binding protein
MMADASAPLPETRVTAEHHHVEMAIEMSKDERLCLARFKRASGNDGEWELNIDVFLPFLSISEASEALNVSTRTISQLIRKGDLKLRQLGEEKHVTWDSLVALVKREQRSRD